MGSKPGIANTSRARKGPFARLLRQAEGDADALAALALAYREFAPEERHALIGAVLVDASEPRDALAGFLAVEDDPVVAARLADLIGGYAGEPRSLEPRATIAQHEDEGEVHLIRPLHGPFAEAMRIAWKASEIKEIRIESIIHMKSLEPLSSAPLDEAIDLVTPLLWQHVRRGRPVPSGADRFARLFSLP